MKRYDSYKPSGISWIGEIPSHWDELKAKYLFTRQNRPVREIDEVVTCFRDGQVTLRKNRRTSGFTESLQECGYQGIRKGDLVIHQMDAFAGSTGISDSDGKSTPVYIVCTPSQEFIYNPYYGYVIRNMGLNGYIQSLYRGIRERSSNFNFDVFSQQYLPIPPKEEQKRIVEFLSAKSTLIETQKKEREREIQLLDELKQAEIANVVTKGVNPDVPMKDSGISWIGKIPSHWEISTLRKFLTLFSEKGHGDKQLLSVTRELGVIVRNTEDKEENHNYIPDDLNGYKLVKQGQFVVNKMKSWQGSYGVSNYEGIVSPAYYVCDLEFPYKPYFSLAIRSKAYIPFFSQMSKGIRVDQWDLSTYALKSIPFIVPPIEEQRAIVEYIERKNKAIDDMIANLRAEIDFLTEYKQRLIADAVTGQIKID